jgi:hypothetical protein
VSKAGVEEDKLLSCRSQVIPAVKEIINLIIYKYETNSILIKIKLT